MNVNGTQLRSGRVTHLKRNFSKTCFFLLLMCVGHICGVSCGTLICLLSVGNSFKTCIISVDFEKALATLFPVQQIHFNFTLSCQFNRGHIREPQNKFWYTKYIGNKKTLVFEKFLFKCVTRLSGVPLSVKKTTTTKTVV